VYHDLWLQSKSTTPLNDHDSGLYPSVNGFGEAYADDFSDPDDYGYGMEPPKKEVHGEKEERRVMAMRKTVNGSFELIFVSSTQPLPFICALTPDNRRQLLYDELVLPRGVPQILEQPHASYHYSPSARPNKSFLTLPCRVSPTGNFESRELDGEEDGDSVEIKWFRNGDEELNTKSRSSSYLLSSGSLLIPLADNYSDTSTFHCKATNRLGTVRSTPAVVRPAFIEPFRESRLDVYPLGDGVGDVLGGGTRIDCQAPRHFPSGFSITGVSGV